MSTLLLTARPDFNNERRTLTNLSRSFLAVNQGASRYRIMA